MIGGHPGGRELTERLLSLGGLLPFPGAKALDLGAGEGISAEYLRRLGFWTAAIDREPENGSTAQGDMRELPFSRETFDLCLAECSLSCCGDGEAALGEAWRVLKSGGILLVSDVFFGKTGAPSLSMGAPLTRERWEAVFRRTGFLLKQWEDATELWKEFFLESLWNGNARADCLELYRKGGSAGCGYFLAVLEKGGTHGLI